MDRCEAIVEFTLGKKDEYKFEDLRNIIRKGKEEKGRIFVGDTFECSEEMEKYLLGENEKNVVVIKKIKPTKAQEKHYKEELNKITGKKEINTLIRRKIARRK